jgi:dTDP-4-dehydrorhamnose 3,5-epimerase
MRIELTPLHGCYLLQPDVHADERGRLVKTFHLETFANYGLATHFVESFYSVSYRGVLRGMHFQLPPHQHAKLVHCPVGNAFDAVVDLRHGSPTQGQVATFELTAEQGEMLYIPPGLAHGWYALTDTAQLVYQVTSIHSPLSDAGVRWDSVGVDWPDQQPKISLRDQLLPPLDQFDSPFVFGACDDGRSGMLPLVAS